MRFENLVILKSKVRMKRQIRANGAVIDAEKFLHKYILHNPVREFRTFRLHSSHLQRLKLYIEGNLIFFYIVNASITGLSCFHICRKEKIYLQM